MIIVTPIKVSSLAKISTINDKGKEHIKKVINYDYKDLALIKPKTSLYNKMTIIVIRKKGFSIKFNTGILLQISGIFCYFKGVRIRD